MAAKVLLALTPLAAAAALAKFRSKIAAVNIAFHLQTRKKRLRLRGARSPLLFAFEASLVCCGRSRRHRGNRRAAMLTIMNDAAYERSSDKKRN